jgi:hypothetical protein
VVKRLGVAAALKLAKDASAFVVEWVDVTFTRQAFENSRNPRYAT